MNIELEINYDEYNIIIKELTESEERYIIKENKKPIRDRNYDYAEKIDEVIKEIIKQEEIQKTQVLQEIKKRMWNRYD